MYVCVCTSTHASLYITVISDSHLLEKTAISVPPPSASGTFQLPNSSPKVTSEPTLHGPSRRYVTRTTGAAYPRPRERGWGWGWGWRYCASETEMPACYRDLFYIGYMCMYLTMYCIFVSWYHFLCFFYMKCEMVEFS